jgi:hypothetical protein
VSESRHSLAWSSLPGDPGDPPEIACPSCRTTLELHQPDLRRPERLLGTCPECGAWCLIDCQASVLARLPDGPGLRGS